MLKGRVVMQGIVVSDGFIEGTRHQVYASNLGLKRPHADTVNEYADVKITNIYEEREQDEVEHQGQRTWISWNDRKVKEKLKKVG